MEKRFQVFVSSTYADLQDERQAVLKAILELNHMPAGMELFPPTDDGAWQLIQDIIDASDYYVLIIGGRYGSLADVGLSYTEKEYDHAVRAHKPVIALLHKDPNQLPRSKTEGDSEAWERLAQFRKKVERRHTCVYWVGADELKARVIIGLTTAIKRHPAIGWVRADKVPTDATVSEVLTLRKRVSELEAETSKLRDSPPPGSEDLASGEDQFEVALTFQAGPETYFNGPGQEASLTYSGSVEQSWNEIFAAVAPTLITEASDAALKRTMRNFLEQAAFDNYSEFDEFKGRRLSSFRIDSDDIDTCIVQLRALGLIQESDKKRSVKDPGAYWMLTPYGNTIMVQLRAVRRQPAEHTGAASQPVVTNRDAEA